MYDATIAPADGQCAVCGSSILLTDNSLLCAFNVGTGCQLGLVALGCAILLGAGVSRGEDEPATWQTFQQSGVSLEVAPTPVQRTLSVCFFLRTPERMSRVVLDISRPSAEE